MFQITFSLSITRGESFPPKGKRMTPDAAKTFLLPIIKGQSYQHNLKWMTPNVAARGFLLTQTQVHDS